MGSNKCIKGENDLASQFPYLASQANCWDPREVTMFLVRDWIYITFSFVQPIEVGAVGRRFESCHPDQSETGFPACLFLLINETGISAGSPE